jgi:hemerythrin superfamily protein
VNGDEVLIGHHRELLGYFTAIEQTPRGDRDRRRELLDELVTELTIHAQIEDEIFYPAVTSVSPLISIAHSEHRQLDDQLAVVLRQDITGAPFESELEALKAILTEHAGEEEREMFPQSHKLGSAKLQELGERLRARQKQLRSSRLTRGRVAVKRAVLRHV